jgi:phage terminase small subunit
MALTPDRKVAGALTCADIEKAGVKPNDIDPEWLDQMVKRLFKELNRQLACIEATKPEDSDTKKATVRAAHVRTLGAIERTLERLARMEQGRVAKRQTRTVGNNDELRASIQHKIDMLLTVQGAGSAPAETEQR